jgi:hypothetical protein
MTPVSHFGLKSNAIGFGVVCFLGLEKPSAYLEGFLRTTVLVTLRTPPNIRFNAVIPFPAAG